MRRFGGAVDYSGMVAGRSDFLGPLYMDPIPRKLRVCAKHWLPLREDCESPMRCALGHPVDDDHGWYVADARDLKKPVERPHRVDKRGRPVGEGYGS